MILDVMMPRLDGYELLKQLRGRVDMTVCVYHGGFERDLSTGKVLSESGENIGYRLCRELDFGLLLTGHQHMSVPGQMLFGTFVVQAGDCGREFIHLRAKADEKGESFESETIAAGGACSRALLEAFADMECGAQDWLDAVVGLLSQPLLPGEPLTMAMEGNALADPHVSEEHPLSSCELAANYLFIEDPEWDIRELRRAQKGKPLKILIPASDQ